MLKTSDLTTTNIASLSTAAERTGLSENGAGFETWARENMPEILLANQLVDLSLLVEDTSPELFELTVLGDGRLG